MVITPASTSPALPEDEKAAQIAARLASGPGFWSGWLAELGREGLLEALMAEGVIARALREAPAGHKYDRVPDAKMTVICVLAACLFPGAGYDGVLATAFGLPGLKLKPGAGTPTGPAFSQARKLLGEQVMKRIFELDAAVPDAEPGIGLLAFEEDGPRPNAEPAALRKSPTPSRSQSRISQNGTLHRKLKGSGLLGRCGDRQTRAGVEIDINPQLQAWFFDRRYPGRWA
jgi:hypothetical protein